MAKRNDPKSAWLLDAEVRTKIEEIKGRWEVSLVFVNTKDPNQLLIQKIGDYRSKNLAEIYARNMQKTAAKDNRGTQKVDKSAYNFNKN
jgi:carbon monoxide dehydrogenase subunit G